MVRLRAGAGPGQRPLDLLSSDEARIRYCEDRIKEMHLPVLRRRGIRTSDRDGGIRLSAHRMTSEQQAEPRAAYARDSAASPPLDLSSIDSLLAFEVTLSAASSWLQSLDPAFAARMTEGIRTAYRRIP